LAWARHTTYFPILHPCWNRPARPPSKTCMRRAAVEMLHLDRANRLPTVSVWVGTQAPLPTARYKIAVPARWRFAKDSRHLPRSIEPCRTLTKVRSIHRHSCSRNAIGY
jgi:hypothetical protein